MYKKIALLMLTVSFVGLKPRPSGSAKKYSFDLVVQAEKRFAEELKITNMIINEFKKRLDAFEATLDKDGFLNLSADDKDKLKYLLHQVISYR